MIDFDSIRANLTRCDSGYAEKVRAHGARETDWLLCSSGTVTEAELLKIYADASGLPVIEEEELAGELKSPGGIAQEYMKHYCCMALEVTPDEWQLLVCDPYALERHRAVFHVSYGKKISFALVRRSLLERLIASAAPKGDEYVDAVDAESEEALRNLASEAQIVRLVNELFLQAAERQASDIHVEPEEDVLIIRFRIDGVLAEYLKLPLTQYPAVASRIKLIADLNIAESRVPQDGRTTIQLGRSDMDIRISTIPTMSGESIVLRLLKKDAISFDLANVGMLPEMQKSFEELIKIPHGMILVVGPTGSGKSTTLYSVVTQLNDRKRKIITIEDPVEYRLPGLSQMQVNAKIDVTFAAGLRSIVRQDPDIILVGEIRDRETADIAINAALTGHLVLSTLHTNDAAGAVSRLQDMGVESFLLASALYGVLSQRLVRKICPQCHGAGQLAGNRCRNCGGSGYRGRTGIFELLLVDDEIRKAIARQLDNSEIAKLAMNKGMEPLVADGMKKVASGITTEAEVKRSAAGG